MRRFLSAVLVLLCTMAPAVGDGLFYRLPDDGMSVKFDLQAKVDAKGQEKAVSGSLLMSSVGQADFNGEKCRWIEIKMMMEIDGQNDTTLAKVLIPEKHLKAGANPIENAVKGFIKMRDQQPQQLNDFRSPQAGPIPVFLCGPLQDEKKLSKEVIDSGIGKIECEGVTGWREFDQGQQKIRVNFENRLSDKAPFGIVASTMKFKIEQNAEVNASGTMTLKLVEIGKEAKSELQDN